jgi:hypothetical protein
VPATPDGLRRAEGLSVAAVSPLRMAAPLRTSRPNARPTSACRYRASQLPGGSAGGGPLALLLHDRASLCVTPAASQRASCVCQLPMQYAPRTLARERARELLLLVFGWEWFPAMTGLLTDAALHGATALSFTGWLTAAPSLAVNWFERKNSRQAA